MIAMVVVGMTLLSTVAAFADWPSDPAANLPVCVAAGNQTSVNLVTDLAGGSLIAWSDARPGVVDIYAQHVLASGAVDPAWPLNGAPICTAAGTQTVPAMASDGARGAIVFWIDARAGSLVNSDLYAQHLLANGTTDPAWPATGLPVCTSPGGNNTISLPVTDGAGGALIAWFDTSNDSGVFAMHVLASGTTDPAWPVNGLPICAPTHGPTGVVGASDGQGGLLVSWTDFRAGAASDIYCQRVQSNGAIAPGWPMNGAAVCTQPGSQTISSMAPDGSAGALLMWQDTTAGTIDLHVQRIRSSGALDPGWPATGRLVAGGPGDQSSGRLRSDGVGGFVAVWRDTRNAATTGQDLFAQRLSVSGVLDPAWPVGGLAVCTAAGTQQNRDLVPDGTGGVIVGWEDQRTGTMTTDVYAQHLLASGSVDPVWPTDGRGVSLATAAQALPRILADGSGGAIVAWQDNRAGTTNANVYAQRVQANGTLGGTVVGVAREPGARIELDSVRPNPSRGDELRVLFSGAAEPGTELALLDVAGRLVASRGLDPLGAGAHEVRFDGAPHLAPGLYFVVLKIPDDTRSSRILRVVVLR
jgi:hypothetical protein